MMQVKKRKTVLGDRFTTVCRLHLLTLTVWLQKRPLSLKRLPEFFKRPSEFFKRPAAFSKGPPAFSKGLPASQLPGVILFVFYCVSKKIITFAAW
ncbi:hypothetical protein [Parabacteroides sp. PF5-6]|uniref:hypothetical protein n=1 Tax=Parabacteroides sp. PF5-6 TaxID=1742403 RepID=UPI0024054445|nr:hypothetical protein [Parabacteroides sp. PF5-6]MDF9828911.1 hypothetical protein [Parabacteroides sp. PF5-6]